MQSGRVIEGVEASRSRTCDQGEFEEAELPLSAMPRTLSIHDDILCPWQKMWYRKKAPCSLRSRGLHSTQQIRTSHSPWKSTPAQSIFQNRWSRCSHSHLL